MNEVSEKLAESLEQLKALQDAGVTAIQSSRLSRTHRERLMRNGFLREAIKGWYVSSAPDEKPGDSTSWYISFWQFCADYLNERLGEHWCLYPEQSINLHVGDKVVPQQLLVKSPQGRNKSTNFIHNTSIFELRSVLQDEIEEIEGVKVYSLPSALVSCSAKHFVDNPVAMRSALAMIPDASEILRILLAGGNSVVAGRLVGAFRNIGRNTIADSILKTMQAADYKVNEVDPFTQKSTVVIGKREMSPYANRIKFMWSAMREDIINHFPEPPQNRLSPEEYLHEMEDKFISDAYHSLSIEGYRVTPTLIEQVRAGDWNPEQNQQGKQHLDAMAAKGYWDAFQQVKSAVERVLNGENAGVVADETHSDWYLALFGPSVVAGIIKPEDLAGYRTGPVYIKQSKHTPPNKDAIRDMLPVFFELLAEEEHPAVRIVLGHFIFVYIHPYADGNGRMGRFLMNLMMAAGGYPWTVIPVERRDEYMQALEAASVEQDIVPFTKFIVDILEG